MNEQTRTFWLLPRRVWRMRLTEGVRWEDDRSERQLLIIAVAGEGRAKLNGSFAGLRRQSVFGVPPGQHVEVTGDAGQASPPELIVLEFTVHGLAADGREGGGNHQGDHGSEGEGRSNGRGDHGSEGKGRGNGRGDHGSEGEGRGNGRGDHGGEGSGNEGNDHGGKGSSNDGSDHRGEGGGSDRSDDGGKGEAALLGTGGPFACPADERTVALAAHLAEQWNATDELARLRQHAQFLELVYRIARDERDYLRRQADDPLETARRRMHDRYADNMTIGQLAEWAGSSEAHFRDRFRGRYGIGPLEYLTAARMRAARKLLLAPGRSVREVAHQVGYRDEFYFSRLFKKRTGVSPSSYAQSRERRIAALGYPAVGQLLALGVRPVAAALDGRWSGYYRSYYCIELPWLQAGTLEPEADELVGELGSIGPDAIVGGDFQGRLIRERLGRIAPALFTPWAASDWREQLRTTAAFVGLPEEAEQFLRSYGLKADAARDRLAASVGGDTVLALCVFGDRLLVYGHRNIGAVLYGDLGLRPARRSEAIEGVAAIAGECLAEFEADRILLMVWEDEPSRAAWSRLRRSESWRRLKAVRNRMVFPISPFPWLEYTAFAHQAVIDEALKLFAAKRPSG